MEKSHAQSRKDQKKLISRSFAPFAPSNFPTTSCRPAFSEDLLGLPLVLGGTGFQTVLRLLRVWKPKDLSCGLLEAKAQPDLLQRTWPSRKLQQTGMAQNHLQQSKFICSSYVHVRYVRLCKREWADLRRSSLCRDRMF